MCSASSGLVIASLWQEEGRIESKGGRGMFLYVGPDQIIPLSGILGTVAGLVMIFWSRVVQVFQKLTGHLNTKSESPRDPEQ